MPSTLSNTPQCDSDTSFSFITKDYNRKITNDSFTYKKCNKSGLIFLSNIPSNLGDYYKEDYYQHLHQQLGVTATRPVANKRFTSLQDQEQ